MGSNSQLIRAKLTTLNEMIDGHVEIGQEIFLETFQTSYPPSHRARQLHWQT